MKTRENELHEPIVETVARVKNGNKSYRTIEKCSVCNCLLSISRACNTKESAKGTLLALNYCPHCGARLREINNE